MMYEYTHRYTLKSIVHCNKKNYVTSVLYVYGLYVATAAAAAVDCRGFCMLFLLVAFLLYILKSNLTF